MSIMYLTGKRETTKGRILELLAKRWPFTAKQVYYKLKKSSTKQVTYQAVFKALHEMTEEGILVRRHFQYQLDEDWLSQSGKELTQIKELYSKKALMQHKSEEEELIYDSPWNAWNDIIKKAKNGYFGHSDYFYARLNRLYYFPLPSDQISFLKSFLSEKDAHIFCAGSCFIDNFVKGPLEAMGAKVHLKTIQKPFNHYLYGDCLVYSHSHPDAELEEEIDTLFRHTKRPDIRFWRFFTSLFEQKIPVRIIVQRNQKRVRAAREELEKLVGNQNEFFEK